MGQRPPSPLATAMAAVLACGPHAALSHRSAAALWPILRRWRSRTEVTTPTKQAQVQRLVTQAELTTLLTRWARRLRDILRNRGL